VNEDKGSDGYTDQRWDHLQYAFDYIAEQLGASFANRLENLALPSLGADEALVALILSSSEFLYFLIVK
jgi:hypothetical protein